MGFAYFSCVRVVYYKCLNFFLYNCIDLINPEIYAMCICDQMQFNDSCIKHFVSVDFFKDQALLLLV